MQFPPVSDYLFTGSASWIKRIAFGQIHLLTFILIETLTCSKTHMTLFS